MNSRSLFKLSLFVVVLWGMALPSHAQEYTCALCGMKSQGVLMRSARSQEGGDPYVYDQICDSGTLEVQFSREEKDAKDVRLNGSYYRLIPRCDNTNLKPYFSHSLLDFHVNQDGVFVGLTKIGGADSTTLLISGPPGGGDSASGRLEEKNGRLHLVNYTVDVEDEQSLCFGVPEEKVQFEESKDMLEEPSICGLPDDDDD